MPHRVLNCPHVRRLHPGVICENPVLRMSDHVVKSAKRLASRPASYSTATKSTAKSTKPAAKTARPKPALKKRTAAEKAPVRKATPAKKASEAKRAGGQTRRPAKPATKGAAKQART